MKIDRTVERLKRELRFVEGMIRRLEVDEGNEKLKRINDRLDEM
ncbi:hypothetical protein [Staphylococcus saprophyticus]|nr:hypothetical protein [Staphylococcus saprophyticus]